MVGLGNPGSEFHRTRHNLGAETVELLAVRHGQRLRAEKGTRSLARARRHGRAVGGAGSPQTYMNESGLAVAALLRRYRVTDIARLVVVHDELDLPTGRVKVKVGGGTAGNNGLKSVHAHVHDPGYVRVRIGIGKPPGREAGVDYVLHRPGRAEREALDVAIEVAADAVEAIATEGVDGAMHRFNTDAAPDRPGRRPPTGRACRLVGSLTPVSLRSLPPLLRHEPAMVDAMAAGSSTLAVPDAATAFVLAGLASLAERRPLLVVTATVADAERMAHDLGAFVGEEAVALFPAWDTLPFERVSPEISTMGQRLRLLWHLRDPASGPGRRGGARARLLQRLGPFDVVAEPVHVAAGPTRSTSRRSWPGSWASGTDASTRSSTAARWPCAAGSSTSSRRPPTCRCASTCGGTRSTG